jgi:hypothetical protein
MPGTACARTRDLQAAPTSNQHWTANASAAISALHDTGCQTAGSDGAASCEKVTLNQLLIWGMV